MLSINLIWCSLRQEGWPSLQPSQSSAFPLSSSKLLKFDRSFTCSVHFFLVPFFLSCRRFFLPADCNRGPELLLMCQAYLIFHVIININNMYERRVVWCELMSTQYLSCSFTISYRSPTNSWNVTSCGKTKGLEENVRSMLECLHEYQELSLSWRRCVMRRAYCARCEYVFGWVICFTCKSKPGSQQDSQATFLG